jgi:TusA-related sulfurtransferase
MRGTDKMRYLKIDVRKSTCQGGGALWSLLSHVRDLPPGDSIEVLTDDYMAGIDIPAWVKRRRWKVARRQRNGYMTFVIERPLAGASDT